MSQVSNSQRALWTGLGLMLIGPFLAALGVVAAVGLAPVFQLEPLLPPGLPPAGFAGITVFVWAAIPSAIATAILVPVVLRQGTFSNLWAAVAGVTGFFLSILFMEMPFRQHVPALAFLAAFAAIGVRYALLSGGILIQAKNTG
ncbi:MAG: hypothetical protein AAGG72_03905 [Pseudomonadota bacterium]